MSFRFIHCRYDDLKMEPWIVSVNWSPKSTLKKYNNQNETKHKKHVLSLQTYSNFN